MIEVQNLSKNYGPFQALKDISFSVDKGQIVGFLGPNGAGKTTTMRILTCFMPASNGKVTVAGYDVFKESREVRKRIGYLPENIPLYTEMTVTKYLAYMAKIRGVRSQSVKERLDSVIESCGLSERRNQIIGHLSRGFRQRVGLAQALVHEPEVLILDEPTSGLDPRQIVEIRELIKGLGKERTVLFSTHILPEASQTCERLLIISKGKITGDIQLSNGRAITKSTDTNEVGKSDLSIKTLTLTVGGNSDSCPDEMIETITNIPNIVAVEQINTPNPLVGGNSDSRSQDVLDANFTFQIQYEMAHSPKSTAHSPDVLDMPINDVRADVAEAVVTQGWKLLEMFTAEMSLEELFLSLTSETVE